MLIKTGYPNLLHGCDFLCINLMNYYLESFMQYYKRSIFIKNSIQYSVSSIKRESTRKSSNK